MSFWRDVWEEIRHPWATPEWKEVPPGAWQYTPMCTNEDDPDWQERQQLREEKRRLEHKHELMQLTEDIDNLRDACEKMQARHEEFEQRHKS